MSNNNAPGRQTFTDQLSSGEPSAQVAPLGKRPLIDLLTCMVCKVTIENCEQHARRGRQRPGSISLRIVQQNSLGAVVPLPLISRIELRQPSLRRALPILGGLAEPQLAATARLRPLGFGAAGRAHEVGSPCDRYRWTVIGSRFSASRTGTGFVDLFASG